MNSTFTFYKRKNTKGKDIFYARFRDPDTGERMSGISTGHTTKGGAQNWAINYLNSGKLNKQSKMLFKNFSQNWYIWGVIFHLHSPTRFHEYSPTPIHRRSPTCVVRRGK